MELRNIGLQSYLAKKPSNSKQNNKVPPKYGSGKYLIYIEKVIH